MSIKQQKIWLINRAQLPDYQKKIKQMLALPVKASRGNLLPVVKLMLKRRQAFLNLAKQHPTPFYVIDRRRLLEDLGNFRTAFKRYLPNSEYYYAMKINNHPYIIKTVIKHGFHIDVSSGHELASVLKLGAKKIVFSGPGKTNDELRQAVLKNSRTTVLMDNFSELARLAKIAKSLHRQITAGVRIHTRAFGAWNKFGIPLNELKRFWVMAQKYPQVKLQGIQFHISWNEDARPYQESIEELADHLRKNFTAAELEQIKFIDVGGGFRPLQAEGYFPYHTPQGSLIKAVDDFFGQPSKFKYKYFISQAATAGQYAQGIARAIDKYLKPLIDCRYFTEPGRIISNNAMHIVLKVVDVKGPKSVILDGGINIVGWNKYESDYIPLINLTHPAQKELACVFYGCLCLPDDLWGYYCYAKQIKSGDVILVPRQGCTTYSLAQNFIKPIPKVYILK